VVCGDPLKTYVIDLDLRAYFDTMSHSLVLDKVAQRVDDDAILRLLKLMLKASGKCGVAQGGVISPLLSNLYPTEVDKMLERMKQITARGSWAVMEWTRFATGGADRWTSTAAWITQCGGTTPAQGTGQTPIGSQ
jgi:retron-type reverse transcriptase